MQSREQLQQRVAELEKQVAALTAGGGSIRGIRRRASWEVAGVPFYDIALGPDPGRGEFRGHAKGFIAIGDMATGVIALGGLARGVAAFGGLAIGLFNFGGLSIGALLAVGGLAIGSVALGGGALGGVALGGGAVGYYACGGGAAGEHAISAMHRDAQAVAFFSEYGLGDLCGSGHEYRKHWR
ncbi:MAG: hypothetical protein ACXWFW_12585 [Usitatibacter sp.]